MPFVPITYDITKRIDADPFAAWTLSALAEHTGYSPYHFARMFAASEGVPPMEYVRRRRPWDARGG